MKDRSPYRLLQKHLNRQPPGFPATPTGADLRLLRHFFTLEEARVVRGLSHRFSTTEEVSSRLADGSDTRDVGRMLSGLARRGSIARRVRNGVELYATLPLVVGMYETRVERLSMDFLKAFSSYASSIPFGLAFITADPPQMRTIPVGESIPPERRRASFDDAGAIIETSPGPFVILECICRKSRAMKGSPCRMVSRTDTCLALGDMAQMCQFMEIGRTVTREEALGILRRNEAEGLVLQPSNTQQVEYVCSCCGCCCGMLRVHRILGKPRLMWPSGYAARVDTAGCTGCGLCIEACQVNALSIGETAGHARVDRHRCIGCGHCVTACPAEAVTITACDDPEPPVTIDDLAEMALARKGGGLARLWRGIALLLRNPWHGRG